MPHLVGWPVRIRLLSGLLSILLCLVVCASLALLNDVTASVSDTVPVVNVKSAPYNAVGDGVADDTAAILAAFADVPLFGGVIFFPCGTYNISTPILLLNSHGRRILGENYPRRPADNSCSNLVYTSSTGSLLHVDGSNGAEVAYLNMAYSHPSYTGILINIAHVNGSTLPIEISLHDNRIGGLSTSSKASVALISLELTYGINIERNVFVNGVTAIRGSLLSVINANAVRIRDNLFLPEFTGPHIFAGGQVWTIEGNIFEPHTAAGEARAFGTTSVGVRGLGYSTNWHGDASSGTWFNVTGGGILGGSIQGNQFQGGGTAKGIHLGASQGVVVTGNEFEMGGLPLDLGTSLKTVAYANNPATVTERFPGPQTLYWEKKNVANTADTNYVPTSEYMIPAGYLATNGDKLTVEMDLVFGGTAGTKTYQCNIGYTAWDAVGGFTGGVSILLNATTHVNVSVHAKGDMNRVTSTTAESYSGSLFSTGAWQAGGYGSSAITWANAQPLRCHAKSSVATAGVVTVKNFRVTFFPR